MNWKTLFSKLFGTKTSITLGITTRPDPEVGSIWMLDTGSKNPFEGKQIPTAKVKEIKTNADGEKWIRYALLLPSGHEGIFNNESCKLRTFFAIYNEVPR